MIFKVSRTKWAIIFACLSMFVLGVADNIRGPLFPELLRFFSLTNSEGSFSFAIASTAACFGNSATAFALRKIHLDRILAISMLLMAVGLFVMGLAPGFSLYLCGALVFGMSLGVMGVTQNLLIAESVVPALQTKVLSGLHGIYGLSSLLAPYLASRSPGWFQNGISEDLSGWRSAFFVASFLTSIVLVFTLGTATETAFQSPPLEENGQIKKSSLRTMLWFAGFFATYVGAEILISTRLALYMRTYFSMNLEESSNYVMYFFIFLLAGRLLFAVKSFQVKLRLQLNLSLILSLVFLIAGLWLHPFFLTLVGFSMAPFYPLAIAYIAEKTGAQTRRFLTFVMGFQSLCVISMHVGVGYVTDLFGLFYAFGIGIILLVLAIVCINFHPEIT